MSDWLTGLDAVMTLQSMLMILCGVMVGLVVGALPGLSATMAVALLLPLTFTMDPLPGLMLLLGIYGAALYSGSIPAILLNAPGTPSAAATVLDGYPLTRQGRGGQALTISLVTSVVGGLVGTVLLATLAPQLAEVALAFGPAEMFMVAVLALSLIASLSQGAVSKGLISGALGVAIGLVGLDPIQGVPRFTMEVTALASGIPFIAVLIGLFGIAEALIQIAGNRDRISGDTPAIGRFTLGQRWLRRLGPAVSGSSLGGFFIGLLPGTGGDIASYVAYNETKRWSRSTGFGKGNPAGVAAAESANNASTAGAMAPTMVLGVPGDSVTAILIGALTVHGLRPGPELFQSAPDLVYGAFIGLILVNLALLPIGLVAIRLWSRLASVPTALLWPLVILLSMAGAFALRTNIVDVGIALGAGALGFVLMRGGYPLAPLVIGLILGPMAESNLRLTMVLSEGSLTWLAQPLPITFAALIVAAIVLTRVTAKRGKATTVDFRSHA
ncbi:putative tricarboxylic transport membrane protein [Spinactinospora alkalitolerans]|uniref:Putative tricarboxylic transport membrane protein n=1 Tax=Spinactinospora alkalitolerans TaxID=687207 RepID=A0A852TZC9_9ACTN|nr:tripartite tricarboxylate transporter permease [Spinactinospora alkalitolerans]NYE48392.1 putative tricarboxylic transport membrane protein [Spinactinospora alkalitolerans]